MTSARRHADDDDELVHFLTEEESWALADRSAQRYMQMSAAEFVRRWKAGEIEDPDRPEVMRVLMVLPIAW